MKNNLDLHLFLNAFNIICKNGEKQHNYHLLQGMRAWSDFDGYTCFLANSKVTMTLLFHGKYSIDATNDAEIDTFTQQVKRLCIANKG
ncbi:DUF3081 family protein [Catenovulum maritimum]|uniref:DUF3081 domain-containing protein n=1 Tax=Catenovulum maritimum TaxID=1513271 RepID=A0A0J8H213_9ALTE|nr:DUF3081 family protein [Catenovulum maritimum]KMT67063.1 hypothetical protein XM47_00250 [Catenovulum maritimum]